MGHSGGSYQHPPHLKCTSSSKTQNQMKKAMATSPSHCPYWPDAHLSMMPFIRMALFQSFRVDFPARCTNSFGLITCSSYWREAQQCKVSSARHRSGGAPACPLLPSCLSLHQGFAVGMRPTAWLCKLQGALQNAQV